MTISIFDLFSIGIGPSSSHTVGPMKAACAFVEALDKQGLLNEVAEVQVDLYGSLALTGVGHGTDLAILNGLEGKLPHTVHPDSVAPRAQQIIEQAELRLLGVHSIPFIKAKHLLFHQREVLPLHTNGMRFSAYKNTSSDPNGMASKLIEMVYYSIGGGFIVTEAEYGKTHAETLIVPYPFQTAKELMQICAKTGLQIQDIMLENEQALHPDKDIREGILQLAEIMRACIEKGCRTEGILPGGLKVKRRAPMLFQKLQEKELPTPYAQADVMNWLNIYGMAVNEENAAGGRVVTAPTNGAAGIIPAVLNYYRNFHPGANDDGIVTFLLTAGAIAILYKKNASISGAEVGCQGEVGVASSMAAGGLMAAWGGSIKQIENAAEMAMEHHLGMTCDPIGGLVQIPCIERNAMGSVKAVNAARIAELEDGEDKKVSLDKVIATMFQTGKDMMTIYKETSLGGLAAAANLPEC
jgi:L-serine dehydratase